MFERLAAHTLFSLGLLLGGLDAYGWRFRIAAALGVLGIGHDNRKGKGTRTQEENPKHRS